MRLSLALLTTLSLSLSAQALPQINSLWNYSEPQTSQLRFEHLIQKTNCQREQAYCLEALTQVARAQGLQAKFQAAHENLDRVRDQDFAGSKRVEVRYLLERGRLLNSAGQASLSVPLFKSAMKQAQDNDLDYFAVDAAHMLGIAAPPREQEFWTRRAIEMAERSSDRKTQNWRGSLYNNLGWTHHDNQRYNEALDIFAKNIAWHQARGSQTRSKIIAKWAYARTLRSLARHEEALTRMHQLMRESNAAGLAQDGYIYEEIAENLWALKRKAEARSYFAKAHALLSKDLWLSKNEPERVARLLQLSQAAQN